MTLKIASKRMNRKRKEMLIPENISIKEAMRLMSQSSGRILFVVDEDQRLKGSLTDGDIRRAVLANGSLSSKIKKIFNANPIFVDQTFKIEDVRDMMLSKTIYAIPVLDKDHRVCEVLLWNDVFDKDVFIEKGKINIPVVIMAGGKGTRLDPFTKILPKPLIPIGDKAIIELIIDRFRQYGVNEFMISISHKSKMMKAFFDEINPDYKIKYIEEKKPLGTAGSLRTVENQITNNVIVSNCDVIIDCNYQEVVDYHNLHGYDVTLVASFRHFSIPYGICNIENGGQLIDIKEKPEYDFLVNTGMYILRKKVLKYIPKNKFLNITDLINHIQEKKGKVGVFPIDEKSWIDVGQWEEYRKAVHILGAEA